MFNYPVLRMGTPQPNLSRKSSVLQARQKRLLFVDDELATRETLSAVLRRYGFTVTLSATVRQAIEEIQKQEFDLLLCDLNLERDADGYEVVRAMRKVNPDCLVIILTGYPGFGSAVEGIHLGIDDYIVNPAMPDTLVALLADKLAARQPKARILSASYDDSLRRTRHILLEAQGYEVISTDRLESSLEQCKLGGFDLFILGHSIPRQDKERMVEAFRQHCSVPIISLRRHAAEGIVDTADYHIEPDPEPLLELIADLVCQKAAAKGQAGSSG
jgi:DNA-binding NtrC family response regulator